VHVDAKGLLFADPAHARPWLQGRAPAPARILVVEGITDFISVAGHSLGDLGVLGIESGSAATFACLPLVPGQAVYLATDPDEQGRVYARQIRAALPPLTPVFSVPLGEMHRAVAA
jgi:hypothetical protein